MNDSNKAEREDAIFMDIVLMGKCQEVWVLNERITRGMSIEIEKAKKDKGGFVGGKLRDNRRKIETVACRSI